MDKLDQRLLRELMYNSRSPITYLAKKLRASREVITYRINKLKREGIILDFITEINISKMGYAGAAVFVDIRAAKHAEFRKLLAESKFVSWVAELSGVWSFGFSIVGKTNEELDERFLRVYNKFRDDIIDHRFTLHRKSSFFYEKYFGAMLNTSKIKKKLIEYKIDKKDKIILQELSKDSRIDAVALAKKVSLTAPAVAKRIKRLEASRHIGRYSIFVDISKLNLFQYSVFIVNKNIDEKEKLIAYLTQYSNISFIAEYVGDPFMEFGLFVKDPYELRGRLQEIEAAFQNTRVIEVSLFQKEFVSAWPPICVFE